VKNAYLCARSFKELLIKTENLKKNILVFNK